MEKSNDNKFKCPNCDSSFCTVCLYYELYITGRKATDPLKSEYHEQDGSLIIESPTPVSQDFQPIIPEFPDSLAKFSSK